MSRPRSPGSSCDFRRKSMRLGSVHKMRRATTEKSPEARSGRAKRGPERVERNTLTR